MPFTAYLVDPEKWRPVTEQIEAARARRDSNTVDLAAKVGVIMGSFLERHYPRAVGYAVDTKSNRMRIVVDAELDLVTGEIEATIALQPPAFIEAASQPKGKCSPTFKPVA